MLAGLVESNLDHRDTGGPEDVLVFGHDSLDLFAWRSSTGEFQVLDLVPRDVLETFPSFDALMDVALRALPEQLSVPTGPVAALPARAIRRSPGSRRER